jgi:hypothetical protein
VTIDKSRRPYFRYGSGKWGQALYYVSISSRLSGTNRSFEVFALPNPDEYGEVRFDMSMFVPILVGMTHAGADGVGLIVDMSDGYSINTLVPNDVPRVLSKNQKGHFQVDLVEFLTGGQTTTVGHCNIVIHESTLLDLQEVQLPDQHTAYMFDMRHKLRDGKPSTQYWLAD